MAGAADDGEGYREEGLAYPAKCGIKTPPKVKPATPKMQCGGRFFR